MDQLGVRLAKEDFEEVWKHLDTENRGILTFTDFCKLNELKSQSLTDPFTLRSLQTTIQDKLALDRKTERDRLAKELVARLEKRDTVGKTYEDRIGKAYGVESLPSDNINSIVKYDFNREFLDLKKEKEAKTSQEKSNKILSSPRDNLANTVRRDRNIAFKLRMEQHEDSIYKTAREKSQDEENKIESTKLPSLNATHARSSMSVKPSKFLRRAFDTDIQQSQIEVDSDSRRPS